MSKSTEQVLNKIFRSPDMQFGFSVFGDMDFGKILNIFEKEKGKF